MDKSKELKQTLFMTNLKQEQIDEYLRVFINSYLVISHSSILVSMTAKIPSLLYIIDVKNKSDGRMIEQFDVQILDRQDLTIDNMIDLNNQAETIFTEDGIYGLKDRNGLDSVLALMNQETFGRDYYPTIIDKASFLWYTIATKQLFHNGNKRTAFLSALIFLKINFFNLIVNNSEKLYKISIDIAEG
ncbi:type II toxin-antitoxin system death-on-curing family toxin, partial [Oenococcus oeni]